MIRLKTNRMISMGVLWIAISLLLFPSVLMADMVMLRNGKLYSGSIVNQKRDELTIQLESGRKINIEKRGILRVLYGETADRELKRIRETERKKKEESERKKREAEAERLRKEKELEQRRLEQERRAREEESERLRQQEELDQQRQEQENRSREEELERLRRQKELEAKQREEARLRQEAMETERLRLETEKNRLLEEKKERLEAAREELSDFVRPWSSTLYLDLWSPTWKSHTPTAATSSYYMNQPLCILAGDGCGSLHFQNNKNVQLAPDEAFQIGIRTLDETSRDKNHYYFRRYTYDADPILIVNDYNTDYKNIFNNNQQDTYSSRSIQYLDAGRTESVEIGYERENAVYDSSDLGLFRYIYGISFSIDEYLSNQVYTFDSVTSSDPIYFVKFYTGSIRFNGPGVSEINYTEPGLRFRAGVSWERQLFENMGEHGLEARLVGTTGRSQGTMNMERKGMLELEGSYAFPMSYRQKSTIDTTHLGYDLLLGYVWSMGDLKIHIDFLNRETKYEVISNSLLEETASTVVLSRLIAGQLQDAMLYAAIKNNVEPTGWLDHSTGVFLRLEYGIGSDQY